MPLEYEINKRECDSILKQYQIIKRVKYIENDKIIYIKYYLGEKNMNNKKMTIEDLALVVNNLTLEMRAGFKSVNERLDKVESRLDKVESRLDRIEEDVSILKREATNHG